MHIERSGQASYDFRTMSQATAAHTAAKRPPRGSPIPAITIAAVIGLAIWAYIGWVHPNLFPENFGVVEPGKLYRSAALTPGAVKRVHERYGIKTIVDLGGFDKDPAGDRIAQRTAEALGIERYVFLLEGDGTGNPNAYVAALNVINDPSKQPVLVHCSAGAQRTSGCIMLYKDTLLGQDFTQTYPEAREYRHDPRRNPHLLPFLEKHEQAIEDAFKSGTQIEGFPKLQIAPVRESK